MQDRPHRLRGLWLLIAVMTLLIGIRHFDLIKAPNSYFIGNSTDGVRSYMAALYHIKHDTTYGHYQGMNYPYGDRVDFTDNMPILSNSIKFISQNIVDISPWTTGIWNVFLLFSILLCGVFLYLIFRELKLPLWYALLVSVGIAFLSPQLYRTFSHYGLAHPFVIPMMIYLLLRFEQKPGIKGSLLIAGAILMTYGLHFYLFALAILMIGFYWLMKLLSSFTLDNFKKVMLHGSLQTVLPFALLLIFFVLNDPITDRPMKPYGFMAYKAYFLSVFFPINFHPGRILKTYLGPMEYISAEGWSYIGATAIGLVVAIVLRRLFKWRSSRLFDGAEEKYRPFMVHLFGSGFILLLFSFGLPISIEGMEFLLNYIGPLKQFRSIGRFAWVFFYISNIIAFYLAFRWAKKIDRKVLRYAFLFLIIGILGLESMVTLFKPNHPLYPHPSGRQQFKTADNPWMETTDWSKYQAILPIPYFHIGSENIWITAEAPILPRSMWTSVQTGLPVISSFMGRTSLSQTLDFMAMVKEPYRPLAILEKMHPEKSILIFVHLANYEFKREKYDFLFEGLHPIYEDNATKLYELKPAILHQRIKAKAIAAHEAFDTLNLVQHKTYLSPDSLATVAYQSFDHHPTEKVYAGSGAFSGLPEVEHRLFEENIPGQKAEVPYICSVWAYVKEDLHPKIWFNIEEFDLTTWQGLWKRPYRLDQEIVAIDGDWALIELKFKLKRADTGVRISAINHSLFKKEMYLDELMMRPENSTIFRQENKWLWLNNRRYESHR